MGRVCDFGAPQSLRILSMILMTILCECHKFALNNADDVGSFQSMTIYVIQCYLFEIIDFGPFHMSSGSVTNEIE